MPLVFIYVHTCAHRIQKSRTHARMRMRAQHARIALTSLINYHKTRTVTIPTQRLLVLSPTFDTSSQYIHTYTAWTCFQRTYMDMFAESMAFPDP